MCPEEGLRKMEVVEPKVMVLSVAGKGRKKIRSGECYKAKRKQRVRRSVENFKQQSKSGSTNVPEISLEGVFVLEAVLAYPDEMVRYYIQRVPIQLAKQASN